MPSQVRLYIVAIVSIEGWLQCMFGFLSVCLSVCLSVRYDCFSSSSFSIRCASKASRKIWIKERDKNSWGLRSNFRVGFLLFLVWNMGFTTTQVFYPNPQRYINLNHGFFDSPASSNDLNSPDHTWCLVWNQRRRGYNPKSSRNA